MDQGIEQDNNDVTAAKAQVLTLVKHSTGSNEAPDSSHVGSLASI